MVAMVAQYIHMYITIIIYIYSLNPWECKHKDALQAIKITFIICIHGTKKIFVVAKHFHIAQNNKLPKNKLSCST